MIKNSAGLSGPACRKRIMKKEAKIPVRKGTFRFAGGQLKKDREGVYYYSDMYFLRNAAILNPHLRTLSCAFCMTCFPSVDARKESGMTQQELSARTGIAQSDISKLENGNANPSLRTLKRLAAAMGKTLRIEFL